MGLRASGPFKKLALLAIFCSPGNKGNVGIAFSTSARFTGEARSVTPTTQFPVLFENSTADSRLAVWGYGHSMSPLSANLIGLMFGQGSDVSVIEGFGCLRTVYFRRTEGSRALSHMCTIYMLYETDYRPCCSSRYYVIAIGNCAQALRCFRLYQKSVSVNLVFQFVGPSFFRVHLLSDILDHFFFAIRS